MFSAIFFFLEGPLRPRLFSISSGPSALSGGLAITVGIVEYKSKTFMLRKGVCTSFLKAQGEQEVCVCVL